MLHSIDPLLAVCVTTHYGARARKDWRDHHSEFSQHFYSKKSLVEKLEAISRFAIRIALSGSPLLYYGYLTVQAFGGVG